MSTTVWNSLEYWFRTPPSGLPVDVAEMAEAYVPRWAFMSADERGLAARAVDILRDENMQRRWEAAQEEKGDPDAAICSWFDYSLHAAHWFDMASVSAREAASLLCSCDPLDDSSDPERITTDETSPEDFKLLLRVFLDAESSAGASRPLIGWIEVAKSRQCKHHSWVTQYLTARERLGMVVVGLDGGALPAAPATGKAPGNFGWTVNKPTRFHGYTWPLYIVVQRWHEAGQQAPPSAFDVLQAWRGELPAEIERVLLDGFDCDGKNVATSALKQAIRRMTSTPTQR